MSNSEERIGLIKRLQKESHKKRMMERVLFSPERRRLKAESNLQRRME